MTTYRYDAVTVDFPDVGELLARGNNAVVDAVMQEVRKETEGIWSKAREYWPVKSGRSKGDLHYVVKVTDNAIRGVVWCSAPYAFYIQSSQISMAANVPAERKRSMHRFARNAEEHAMIDEMTTAPAGLRAYVTGPGGGKLTGAAAKKGVALWLLLRWPEKAAGDRLTERLAPLIEHTLQGRV